jgi:hypothetical protein
MAKKVPIFQLRKATPTGVVPMGFYGNLKSAREKVATHSKNHHAREGKRWSRVDNQSHFRTERGIYVVTRHWLNDPELWVNDGPATKK